MSLDFSLDESARENLASRAKAVGGQAREGNASHKTDEQAQIVKAKAAGRHARKHNCARKTEEQLINNNGYTLEQAKAYLEAYDAASPDDQEKLQMNLAKASGRKARKVNCARKTEEQLMSDNGYTLEQAKAYLEAFDRGIPANEEKNNLYKAKDSGRRACKRNTPSKTEVQLMSDGYTQAQATAYLEAYDTVIPDKEVKRQISLAKTAGREAHKRNVSFKTEEQLISDNGYTQLQAKAYLEAYDAATPNQEKLKEKQAKHAGREARKTHCARKTEEQLMIVNGYTPAQAKAYLQAYDAVYVDELQAQIRKAKAAGREARKTNCARKTEEQLIKDNHYTQLQAKAYLEAYDAATPNQEKLKEKQAKHAGREARKTHCARKTEEQLMIDEGYTQAQARAYLQAYDDVNVTEEQVQIRKAKAAGREARKTNCARKTEEQLINDNHYTQLQAKAYLEAYVAATPNQEKLKEKQAKHAGREARKTHCARKTEEQLMIDEGYTQAQARAYLQAYDDVNVDDEQVQIRKAKAAGREARKANYARKTEEQLMSDNDYTPAQARAYLQAYDAANVDDKQVQIRKAKAAGRRARKHNYSRKTEEQLMSDNNYTPAQAKAYLQAYDAVNFDEEQALIMKAKAAGRQACKQNTVRKPEEQLMSDNGYTLEQAKAYLQVYDATVATKAEKAQIKDANLLKRKGENSPEVLAKRHAKNVSAQGDSESPLSTNTASSQCELPPENSIDILIDAIFEHEKTQNMRPYYSAVSRRDTESSVDKTLVNADADSAKARQKLSP